MPSGASTIAGDDGQPGERLFWECQTPLALQYGGELAGFTLAYETWGELNAAHDNCIVVSHALTGDSHVTGDAGPGHPTPGWWPDLVGPGRPLDSSRFFVVCVNVLGGCRGTTGPSSLNPETGAPFALDFPLVSIRDMVASQARLLEHLGVQRVVCVLGGSMGGQQVLEWGVQHPDLVRGLVPLAANFAASPQQISFGSVGRKAITLDPDFHDGAYYGRGDGHGPARGLAIARMIAHITYRSDASFISRFGRALVEGEKPGLFQRFEVESYLDYHGDKLVRRFDANTYLYLTKAMDLHDVFAGFESEEAALRRIRGPVLMMGVSSDILFPTHQQIVGVRALRNVGVPVSYFEIESPHGHDGFLIETEVVGARITRFLADLP